MKREYEAEPTKSAEAINWKFKALRSRGSSRKSLWRESSNRNVSDSSWLKWTKTLIGRI